MEWKMDKKNGMIASIRTLTTLSYPQGHCLPGTNLEVVVRLILTTFFFFFFFFGGSGRRLCRQNQEKSERGNGLPAPAADSSMEWHPISRHRLFSRTLPTITCRNLV